MSLGSDRLRRTLALALPIVGGMTSQNLLNVVDTAMVGSLGDRALAAVGIASFANFMSIAFITGMAAGVQAMVARWLGEGRIRETAVPLNGGLLLAVGIGLPASILLVAAVPYAMPVLAGTPEVSALATPYLQVRLLATVGVGMNFAFRGYWNAIDMSRVYMGTLLLMHAANIFGNWVLIFGHLGAPALGVTGAALASASAVYLGTASYFVLGLRRARVGGFLGGIPERAVMRSIVRLSVPAGLQQFFFAAGMTALFWIVGQVGVAELAAAQVLTTLMLVTILPAVGFGLAAATLVGQSLGARDPVGAEAWGWHVSRVAMSVVGVLAAIELLAPDVCLGPFLHDPATLALARWPLRVVGATAALDAAGIVLLNAHLGAGDTKRVMKVSVGLQWGVFLPAAYALGPLFGFGLLAIWLANAGFRLLMATVFAHSWRRRRWADVPV